MFRVVLLVLALLSNANHLRSEICPSMDIRNSVSNLGRLRNCTEIAGHLWIVLLQSVESEAEFDDYVFPELTQISGYLIFYDVSKLTSMAKLFPNLRVIRGLELFKDSSLVIHSMPDLTEIGTEKLLFIARGLVRIDKCPHLCYVDTVDWQKILVAGSKGLHFSNSNSEGCEPCPRECGDYCWNSMTCQDIDTPECHEECLGCFEHHSAQQCHACKNYEDDGVCVPVCPPPPKKYVHKYVNKCVTEKECRDNLNGTLKGTWFPFNGECVSDCPARHQKIVDGDIKCEFCGSNCTKYCNVTEDIESMDKLQQLKGCTHIEGSLALSLADVDPRKIIGELGDYLGSITYIRDSLIIARTEAVTTLTFLQNLTEIEGKKLENQHAIFMYENVNLQTLWNFSDPNFNLTIRNGTIAFHDNPLLCISEIEKLANFTGVDYNDTDVSIYSNGDKAACNKTDVKVSFKTTPYIADISWKEQACHGECIGYTIFYRAVKRNQNVSTFDSKDVCIDTYWNSFFTSNTSTQLRSLQPYTRYAFYLKIYHQKSRQGSQSDIIYFTTDADDPDNAQDVLASAVDSETIMLSWLPPRYLNGNMTHYIVDYNIEPDYDLKYIRNYCQYPKTSDGDKIDEDSKLFKSTSDWLMNMDNVSDPLRDNPCLCATKKRAENIYFSDLSIFNLDERFSLCDMRSLSKFGFDNCKSIKYMISNDTRQRFTVEKRSQLKENPERHLVKNWKKVIPSNVTSWNITDLQHFTLYVFYFSACNTIKNGQKCSGVEQTFARTKHKRDADDIQHFVVRVSDNVAKIKWSEPKLPNSMILAYRVVYTQEDVEHAKPTVVCISRDYQFNGSQYALSNLPPGKYSMKIQAESLAGPGRYSREVVFEISVQGSPVTTIVSVLIIIILAGAAALVCWVWWHRRNKFDAIHLITTVNPEYDGLVYEADEWEIDRSDIELQTTLGHGTFGTVYYGKIISKNLPCALKTTNENINIHDRMEFLNEASVMKSFSNSHHVVRLLGVVSRGEPPLVVMELMEKGDLKRFLHRMRDSSHSLTSNEIYRMAVEIADGMAYLSAKKFVHRDLAARNCMVASDRTIKIGDFGMARDIYETDYYKKETKGLLPVRWMAPESLADGVFTSDSDVWSYGVVLWEIATLAEQPYQGLSNEQVLQFVISKGRLERPSECSDLFYEVMKKCWGWRPIDRPSFWDIVEKLEDHVGEDFKLVSFIHSRDGVSHRTIHRTRTYYPPAMSTEPDEELICHYNVSDDEVSLHVGTAPRRPSYLQSSISQRKDGRRSPNEFY